LNISFRPAISSSDKFSAMIWTEQTFQDRAIFWIGFSSSMLRMILRKPDGEQPH
jgi:hypothetical protein